MPSVKVLSCPQCGASIKNTTKTSKSPGPDKLIACEYCGSALAIRAADKRDSQQDDRSEKYPKGRSHHYGLINCPRCRHKLLPTSLPAGTLQACKHCAGLWLPNAVIDSLKRRSRSTYQSLKQLNTCRFRGRTRSRLDLKQTVHCPDCGDTMQRKVYRAKRSVRIDYCDDHGVWFDQDELMGTYLKSKRKKKHWSKYFTADQDSSEYKYRGSWRGHSLFAIIWLAFELIDEIFD